MSKKIKDNESIQPLINLLQLGELSFSVLGSVENYRELIKLAHS